MSKFKEGDWAIVRNIDGGEVIARAGRVGVYSGYGDSLRWWYRVGHSYVHADLDRFVRRIAVIDPENATHVVELRRALHKETLHHFTPSNVAAVVRRYTAPDLDEPMNWGAKVTDAEGIKWLRASRVSAVPWSRGDLYGTWEDVPQPAEDGWDS